MNTSTKAVREFQSLFNDPILGLAILKKNKICLIKPFRRYCSVQSLDLYNSGICSLEGIRIFKNLKILNIEGNKVEDLSPLSQLRKLKELNLYNNNVKTD